MCDTICTLIYEISYPLIQRISQRPCRREIHNASYNHQDIYLLMEGKEIEKKSGFTTCIHNDDQLIACKRICAGCGQQACRAERENTRRRRSHRRCRLRSGSTAS